MNPSSAIPDDASPRHGLVRDLPVDGQPEGKSLGTCCDDSLLASAPTHSHPECGSEAIQIDDAKQAMTDTWICQTHPSLVRMAWAMTGDCAAAEDLAQETLVIAFQKWDSYAGRSSRRGWAHGILIQLTRKHFRSLARWRRRLERYTAATSFAKSANPTSANAINQLAAEEWRRSVWAQVAKLPRSQAESIALRFDQQLSYDEIGVLLDCPTGTVKSRVHHGLMRLRRDGELSFPPQFDAPFELRFQ